MPPGAAAGRFIQCVTCCLHSVPLDRLTTRISRITLGSHSQHPLLPAHTPTQPPGGAPAGYYRDGWSPRWGEEGMQTPHGPQAHMCVHQSLLGDLSQTHMGCAQPLLAPPDSPTWPNTHTHSTHTCTHMLPSVFIMRQVKAAHKALHYTPLHPPTAIIEHADVLQKCRKKGVQGYRVAAASHTQPVSISSI